MPKYKLKPVTALDNYQANINGVKISEIVNIEIFSFAIKLNDEKKAASSMKIVPVQDEPRRSMDNQSTF